MLVLTDTDPAVSREDLLQFEEILGKKLPEAMKDFYLKYNGGQPQVRGATMNIISFLSIPLIHLRR